MYRITSLRENHKHGLGLGSHTMILSSHLSLFVSSLLLLLLAALGHGRILSQCFLCSVDWVLFGGQRLRAVTRTCLCPGVSSPYIVEHNTLGGLPWCVLGGAPIKPLIKWGSKMVAHSLDCDHLCVHTNILPLDHQAKLISPLFNEMTHQDKRITMVNHKYHWTHLL